MVKIVKDPVTGLTPQQEAFAVAVAKGFTQADAYRQAVNVRPGTKDTSVHVNACKMAADPNVKQRVRQLLSDARVADIDNVGQAWRDMLDILGEARDEKNYTAVAALLRQRLQCGQCRCRATGRFRTGVCYGQGRQGGEAAA